MGLSQTAPAGRLRQPADDVAAGLRTQRVAGAAGAAGAAVAPAVREPAQRPSMAARATPGIGTGHAGLAGFPRRAPARPLRRARTVHGAAAEPARPGLPAAGRPVDVHRCAPE